MPGKTEVWSIVPRFLTGRTSQFAAHAAVLTAVIGGGATLFPGDDGSVTLSVDGVSRHVSVDDETVGELLDEEGIRVGERDLVAPAPSTRLRDGAKVVVRFARPVTLTLNGRTGTYWTTETTVAGALMVLGIRTEGARMSVSRSASIGREGLSLSLTQPRRVDIEADGTTRTVLTTSATVGALLQERGIRLGDRDRLSVDARTPVVDGLTVTVTRIRLTTVTETESIAYGTTRRSMSSLAEGSTTVITPGRAGVRRVTYRVVLADGEETRRTRISSTVVREPVTRVLGVGTRSSSSSSSGSGGDGLNWAALAECESGGDPTIVSSNGLYHGLYQFSVSTWKSVGGTGLPSAASAAEQTSRAKLLYQRSGADPWPVCGSRLFS